MKGWGSIESQWHFWRATIVVCPALLAVIGFAEAVEGNFVGWIIIPMVAVLTGMLGLVVELIRRWFNLQLGSNICLWWWQE